MGCNRGSDHTGPGCAGLHSFCLISPSCTSPVKHGARVNHMHTCAASPVARETGGRFLRARALGKVGSCYLWMGVEPPGAREGGTAGAGGAVRSKSITDMDEDPTCASPVSLPTPQLRPRHSGTGGGSPIPQVKAQMRLEVISTNTYRELTMCQASRVNLQPPPSPPLPAPPMPFSSHSSH